MLNVRATVIALIGLSLTATAAQAGGFGVSFHYGDGPRYYRSSCYRPAYYAPVRYYEPAPVVYYDEPRYSYRPVVYADSYYAPVVYHSRPSYRVYRSYSSPVRAYHRGYGRRVAYYR